MVGRADGNVGVRVGRAGEAVSSNIPPLVDAVPHPELVAFRARYDGPTQDHFAGAGLRSQSRHGARRRGYGHRDILGPCAPLAVGVHCADGVVVGRADGNVGVRVGRAGEAVSSNIPPFVDAVPHPELVAFRARYGGPTQVHCAAAGLRSQSRHGDGGLRGSLLRRGQLREKQEDGDGQEGNRQPATRTEQGRQTIARLQHGSPPQDVFSISMEGQIIFARLLNLTSLVARVYGITLATVFMAMIILSHYLSVNPGDFAGESQERGELW